MAYNGTIDLISGIRPKGDGAFPLVKAHDVYIDDETRLDAKLSDLGSSSNIASVETDNTADMVHVPGTSSKYFIYDNKLYEATDVIAVGDTITEGANCRKVTGGIGSKVGAEEEKTAMLLSDELEEFSGATTGWTVSSVGKWSYSSTSSAKVVTIPSWALTVDVTGHADNGSIIAFLNAKNYLGTLIIYAQNARICMF